MKYYSVTKEDTLEKLVEKWMDLETILSVINQVQKIKYHRFLI